MTLGRKNETTSLQRKNPADLEEQDFLNGDRTDMSVGSLTNNKKMPSSVHWKITEHG